MFERESDELIAIVDHADLVAAEEPVLISRITGIEDSSRNWSLLMVLEHLCMTNREMLTAIDALRRDIVPRGEIDIAMYKPDVDIDLGVIDRFKDGVYDFIEVVRAHINNRGLNTRLTCVHPWFGELNAHKWNCLAAIHTKIHRRQAQAIVAKQGVV